jgi:DNA-binding IscR family transcriptional regulator
MLLRTICQMQRDLLRPAPSRILAEQMNIPARTMRYYLRRLESKGLLSRPKGRNSGYQAARPRVMPMIRLHEQMWAA